jgi:hypothetical protein
MKNKITLNNLLKYVGSIIMIIAVVMIIKKLLIYKVDYSIIFAGGNIMLFGGIILIYCLLVIFGGIPWQNLLNVLYDTDIKYKEIVFIIVKSNILKYVPGNILQYVGRNELAIQKNMKHSQVAFATVLDLGWYVFSTLLISIIVAKDELLLWIGNQGGIKSSQIIFTVSVFMMCAILIYCFYRKKKDAFHEILNRLLSIKFLGILLINLIFYAGMGIANSLMYMKAFSIISGQEIATDVFATCIGAVLIATIIGFITPGAPGGIGIREAVSLFLLKNVFDEAVVVSGIVIMRVLAIFGDIISFLIVWLFLKVRRENKYVD